MRQNWKKNMKFDENVETATAGALKCCGGSLCDNLSDLHERKAPQREGLKRRSGKDLSSAMCACGKS